MSEFEQSFLTDDPSSDPDHPMHAALQQSFSLSMPVTGDLRTGQVVLSHKNEVLIDIGAKSEAIIPSREVETLNTEARDELSVGNSVTVVVLSPEDNNGNIIVSYVKAMEEKDWDLAAELLESQEVYEGKVAGYNKGGLLVNLGHLRGFVPMSQLSPNRRIRRNANNRDNVLSAAVGSDLFAKVIEVNRERNRLILSERAAEREVREARRSELLESLEDGVVRKGHVVNLADFGAFVDIGGIEGLVHLSELSWKRINNPGDILEVGDEVEVYVLNVDRERQRVALSMKRLENDPWTTIDDLYQVGQLVEVTISKLARYGAFAAISDDYGLEGLIHISEMSDDHIKHPSEVVARHEVTTARIIRIDPDQRQIGLSLKQVTSDRYMDVDLAMAGRYDEEDDSDYGD